MITPPDNGASYAGTYGLAGNDIAAWLLNRGHGELLALTMDEFREPLKAPRCPSPTRRMFYQPMQEYIDLKERCPWTMLYRHDGWACFEHDTPVRLPLPMRLQEAPKLIDYGHGPELFKGFTADELVALAGKTIEVVYKADEPGAKASWRYEVGE